MKQLFTKKHYTAIIISLAFLCNPNFHTVDILPDFIGYLLMATAIGHAAEIAPYFAEIKTGLYRLALITFIKLPATLVMYGNMYAGRDIVPLFVLVFSILELLCLIPLIANAYAGLSYLGQRGNVKALLSPVSFFGKSISTIGLRSITLFFVILKATLNTLPTLCLLTYTDVNMAHTAQNMYPTLEISNLSIVIIAGILWWIIVTKYVKAIRKEGGIADGLLAMAGEMRLEEIERKIRMRGLLGGIANLFASSFLSFNIALEQTGYINILPRYILCISLLLAFCRLCDNNRLRRTNIIIGAIASITALLYQITTLLYFNKYTYLDILENKLAKELYGWVEAFSVLETVAFIAFLVSLTLSLFELIRCHTGMSPTEEGYSKASKARHTKLMRKGIILFALYSLTSIGSCINVFLWGNSHSEFTEGADGVIDIMAEPAASWFGTVLFAACVILVIYSYMFTNELRDEIRMKYDINL